MWHLHFFLRTCRGHDELVSRVTLHFAKDVARFFVVGSGGEEDKRVSLRGASL